VWSVYSLISSLQGGLIFFPVCAYGAYLFLNMALKWKRVMTKWYEYEAVFLASPYVEPKVPMARKIRVTAFTIFFLALGKHGLMFSYLSPVYMVGSKLMRLVLPSRTYVIFWIVYLQNSCADKHSNM
jgi:Trehalose receptor